MLLAIATVRDGCKIKFSQIAILAVTGALFAISRNGFSIPIALNTEASI